MVVSRSRTAEVSCVQIIILRYNFTPYVVILFDCYAKDKSTDDLTAQVDVIIWLKRSLRFKTKHTDHQNILEVTQTSPDC